MDCPAAAVLQLFVRQVAWLAARACRDPLVQNITLLAAAWTECPMSHDKRIDSHKTGNQIHSIMGPESLIDQPSRTYPYRH